MAQGMFDEIKISNVKLLEKTLQYNVLNMYVAI